MRETHRLIRSFRHRERLRLLVVYLTYGIIIASSVGILAGLLDMVSARQIPIREVMLFTLGLAVLGSVTAAAVRKISTERLLVRTEEEIGTASLFLAANEIAESEPGQPSIPPRSPFSGRVSRSHAPSSRRAM